MYAEVTRPMNDRERQALTRRIHAGDAATALRRTLRDVVLCVTTGVLFILLAGRLTWFLQWRDFLGVAAFVVFGGAIAVFGVGCLYMAIQIIVRHVQWSRQHGTFIRRVVPSLREALQDGRVVVKRVVASAVTEVFERENEGEGYLFDVGDRKVLFLKGPDYFAREDCDPWPNTEFEIVRTLRSGHWVGIFCLGDRLEPVRTILGEDVREEYVWGSREELRLGSLEDVEAKIVRSRGG